MQLAYVVFVGVYFHLGRNFRLVVDKVVICNVDTPMAGFALLFGVFSSSTSLIPWMQGQHFSTFRGKQVMSYVEGHLIARLQCLTHVKLHLTFFSPWIIISPAFCHEYCILICDQVFVLVFVLAANTYWKL